MIRNLRYAAGPVLLDSLGVVAFAALLAAKVELALAVAVGATFALGAVLWSLVRKREVPALQWISLAAVAVSGAAALVAHDARFAMAKPTVVYLLVAAAMLRKGWLNRYLPEETRALVGDVMTPFGYVWSALMAATAAANLAVAVLWPEAWPVFIAVFPAVSKLALFAVHFAVVQAAAQVRRPARAGAGA